MEKRKSIMRNAIFIFIAFAMFFSILTPSFSSAFTYASDNNATDYSSVIEDLEKDESFEINDYPPLEDYSLHVINIAESVNNELFVYVYQNSKILATTINISLNLHKEVSFKNYELKLLSESGSLHKYVVKNLITSNENLRYYEISSIFRAFDEIIDKQPGGNNETTEVSYAVGKLYTVAVEEDGSVVLSVVDIDVVTVTDKYVGFVRHDQGYIGSPGLGMAWHKPGRDSHFVAFSTDKNIDKLFEADIYYNSQSFQHISTDILGIKFKESNTFGDVKENYSYVNHSDFVTLKVPQGGGLLNQYVREYEFDRIQKTNEFLETEDREWVHKGTLFNVKETSKITDNGLNNIKNKQWVLRFAETPFSDYRSQNNMFSYSYYKNWTAISDVTVLRLKFETDGVVYNLGVIDDKTTGDGFPVNEIKVRITPSTLLMIIIGIGFLIVLSLILNVLNPIILFIALILKPFKNNKEKRE